MSLRGGGVVCAVVLSVESDFADVLKRDTGATKMGAARWKQTWHGARGRAVPRRRTARCIVRG